MRGKKAEAGKYTGVVFEVKQAGIDQLSQFLLIGTIGGIAQRKLIRADFEQGQAGGLQDMFVDQVELLCNMRLVVKQWLLHTDGSWFFNSDIR